MNASMEDDHGKVTRRALFTEVAPGAAATAVVGVLGAAGFIATTSSAEAQPVTLDEKEMGLLGHGLKKNDWEKLEKNGFIFGKLAGSSGWKLEVPSRFTHFDLKQTKTIGGQGDVFMQQRAVANTLDLRDKQFILVEVDKTLDATKVRVVYTITTSEPAKKSTPGEPDKKNVSVLDLTLYKK